MTTTTTTFCVDEGADDGEEEERVRGDALGDERAQLRGWVLAETRGRTRDTGAGSRSALVQEQQRREDDACRLGHRCKVGRRKLEHKTVVAKDCARTVVGTGTAGSGASRR